MPSEVPLPPSPSLFLLAVTGAEQPRGYCWVLIDAMFSFFLIPFGLPPLLGLQSCFQSATFFFFFCLQSCFQLGTPFSAFFHSSSDPFLAFYTFLASNLLLPSHPCFGCPCLGLREGQHCSWAILDSGKHT